MNHTILFKHKGFEQEMCKDICQYKDMPNGVLVAVADGVSSQKYSALGAAAVQENIAGMLGRQSNLEGMDDVELKLKVAQTIRRTLCILAEEMQCEEAAFASTLMMAIFPENANFYWTIHIGDGLIGLVESDEKVSVLSAAQNGITKQFTYTTVSADLLKRIRIQRHDRYGTIFLMTDGITNEIFKDEEARAQYVGFIKKRDWAALENKLIEEEVADDVGFCGICFENK